MNCNSCRNLIMDYIDDELQGDIHQAVQEHLYTCKSCMQDKESLLHSVVTPLRTAQRYNPPSRVWDFIQEKITSGIAQPLKSDFIVRLGAAMAPKRLKLVAVAASIILIVSLYVTMRGVFISNAVNDYLEENAYFMAQLSYSEDENLFTLDDVEFGTMIENYFL